MISAFSSAVLLGIVRALNVPIPFLLQTFFPKIVTEESESIHFDVEVEVLKLAPFVHPDAPGALVEETPYRTDEFTPANIRMVRSLNPSRPLKRVMGEKLLGEYSPQQRLEILTVRALEEMKKMRLRRMEHMAASALRTASVTVVGENYPTSVVNFQRDAALTVTLGAGVKWSDAGVNPLKNLADWGQIMLAKSGTQALDVVMDIGAWNAFRENPFVKDRLTTQRALKDAPSMRQDTPLVNGATFMGVIDGFNIWVYIQIYKDDAGVVQSILPNGTVLMVGPLEGVQHYGAIANLNSLEAVPEFPSSWEQHNPSRRFVMLESAPLVVPTRVNATLSASVL